MAEGSQKQRGNTSAQRPPTKPRSGAGRIVLLGLLLIAQYFIAFGIWADLYHLPLLHLGWTDVAVRCGLLLLPFLIYSVAYARSGGLRSLWGFTAMTVLAGVMPFVGYPYKIRVHPKEEQAKKNLHAIQLAVEHYASDHYGSYPYYLLGGHFTDDFAIDAQTWESFKNSFLRPYASEVWANVVTRMETVRFAPSGMGDRLICEGYTLVYSDNPYSPRKTDAKSCIIPFDGGTFSRRSGGLEGHSTAQIAADHRFEGAEIGERYWEWERGSELAESLQGNFYYKALIPPGEEHPRGYILMAFGNADNPGMDVFTTVPGGHELDGRLLDGSGIGMGVPVMPELGLEPDGKPDGVIIVLSGGWPRDGE